ncbi:MAG TPA: urease accessory protein UreD [Terriglobales bacterium]|nr:urease accessory protein UreD [Terriglobales bacterium]
MDPHGSPARVGRDGALSLRVERRGTASVLAGCRFTLPLQVLTPLALDDTALVVSILNPTGALFGGDRLRIEVHAAPGAHTLLTTPSATKVHRTDGPDAEQDVRLTVAAGAVVEWVPDHTIPFTGSAYRGRLHAHVGAGGGLVVVDAFSAGRVTRGESWGFRSLESALTIVDDEGWLLHDRFVLPGAARWGGLGFTEGAPYFATVAVVSPAPVDDLVAAARAGLAAGRLRAGVGRLPRRGVLVRCLADDAPALEHGLRALWDALRPAAVGAAPVDLRKP